MKKFIKLLGFLALGFVALLFIQRYRILKLRKETLIGFRVPLDKSYFPLNLFIDWVEGEDNSFVIIPGQSKG